ncbi:hypothetical protein NDI43_18355 [Microcoleus vaginatus GB2-A3]
MLWRSEVAGTELPCAASGDAGVVLTSYIYQELKIVKPLVAVILRGLTGDRISESGLYWCRMFLLIHKLYVYITVNP